MFGDKLNLSILGIDSPEALEYNFRSATNVLVDHELISLDLALNKEELKSVISEKMAG